MHWHPYFHNFLHMYWLPMTSYQYLQLWSSITESSLVFFRSVSAVPISDGKKPDSHYPQGIYLFDQSTNRETISSVHHCPSSTPTQMSSSFCWAFHLMPLSPALGHTPAPAEALNLAPGPLPRRAGALLVLPRHCYLSHPSWAAQAPPPHTSPRLWERVYLTPISLPANI